MLVSKFIPEVVEIRIMGPKDDVTELMQQGICNLLHGQELPRVIMISQPDEDPLCAVDIETLGLLATPCGSQPRATYLVAEAHQARILPACRLSSRASSSSA